MEDSTSTLILDCNSTTARATGLMQGWRGLARLALLLALCAVMVWGNTQTVAAQGNVIDVTTVAPDIVEDGACSLAEAIENANANDQIHADCTAGAGDDTIRLGVDATYTYVAAHNFTNGGNALPVIASNITLEGNSATLARSTAPQTGQFRFFQVAITGTLTLDNLTLTGGNPIEGDTVLIYEDGGAIYNAGSLTVRDATLHSNAAADGGAIVSLPGAHLTVINSALYSNTAVFNGGAIAASGAMTVENSELHTNQAVEGSGGAIQVGGSQDSDASAQIHHSQIHNNTAERGGGGIAATSAFSGTTHLTIAHTLVLSNTVLQTDPATGLGGGVLNTVDATLAVASTTHTTIVDSTIRGNRARNGGGIASTMGITTPNTALNLALIRSLIVDNEADGDEAQAGNGGGLYNANGQVVIGNSTFSGNRATGSNATLGGQGGAVANFAFGVDAEVEIINSTLMENSAARVGGALSNFRPVPANARIEVENTILAFNSAATPNTNTCSSDTSLSIVSRGHNLETTNSCGFNQASDQLNVADPRIDSLADNGGPTLTHALRAGSRAINRGNSETCNAAPINQRDQRGLLRFVNACDIGAFEFIHSKQMLPTMLVNSHGAGPGNDDEENGDPENGEPENGDEENGDPENGDPENGVEENGDPENGEPENGDPENGVEENDEPENGGEENDDPENGEPENGDEENGEPENGGEEN